MKYSEKLESIPKEKSQELTTYLSELQTREATTTRRQAASQTGIDESIVQTILSELTASGVLQAKIQIRCPTCNTQHGIYARRSEVPHEEERCFECETDFFLDMRSAWEVIYEVTGDPDDFFRNTSQRLTYYAEEARDLPSSFFRSELSWFRNRDDPKQRGRDFDVLMGLLFQQLPNVRVRLKGSTDTGEVDVYVDCLDSPDWICRMMGSHTMIENKWISDPVQTKEISAFREKTLDIGSCKAAYFISMSGFTRGRRKQLGALGKLKSYSDPRMIDLWEDDVEEMMDAGTPEEVLRSRMLR